MTTRIKNGKCILPDGIYEDLYLYFTDDTITAITKDELTYEEEIDAKGHYVSPGFIDMHVHGGGGRSFAAGDKESIIKAAGFHAAHGTTSVLATSSACSPKRLVDFLRALHEVMEEKSAPSVIGAHLEGSYFSLAQSGAQNPEFIKAPDPEEYEMFYEEGKGHIMVWSFAPELPGGEAFAKFLIEKGIIPSIGHSDATYADVKKVYDLGCRAFTHLYSGMSTITRDNGFRRLGVIESAYLLDDVHAEIIADGCHLPPELLQLIVKRLGVNNLCLITDALQVAGMEHMEQTLTKEVESLAFIVEDGVAKLPDRSAFAGSIATTNRLVKTMIEKAGVSLEESIQMMTANPARFLNLTKKGKLAPGLDADIVIFDDEIEVKRVIIGGNTFTVA